ncbi:MAG: hypothetical protein JNL74_02575 [Fibrobacteres bacterium]|nr:hypothetical protein [Fibrobacterota bacterium]
MEYFYGKTIEEVFQKASEKDACWKIGCTTCGGTQLRSALLRLVIDRNERNRQTYLGLNENEMRSLLLLLKDVSIETIRRTCKYPDWLGYLGVALFMTKAVEQKERIVSESLINKLLDEIHENSPTREYFLDILQSKSVLIWQDLEKLEYELI